VEQTVEPNLSTALFFILIVPIEPKVEICFHLSIFSFISKAEVGFD
jgi:hypothetical protein